jgi:hypothetical protein
MELDGDFVDQLRLEQLEFEFKNGFKPLRS